MIEELQDQLSDIMFYVWLVMLVWCGVGDRGATGPAERHHVLRVACDAGVVWCR